MPPGYTVAPVRGCGPGARELWSAVLDEHERRGPHAEPSTVAEVLEAYERSAYLAFDSAAIGRMDRLGPPLVLLAGPSFDGPLATRVQGGPGSGFDPASLSQGAPCRLRRRAGSRERRPFVLAVGDALDLELDPAVVESGLEPWTRGVVDWTELTPGSQAVRRAGRVVELLVDDGAEDGLGWLSSLDGLGRGTEPSGDLGALVDGWTRVLEGAISAPPADLLGRGPGATPSGDDVISGTLIALNRTTTGRRYHLVRTAGEQLVEAAAGRTTTVSTALLAQAARGRCAGRIDAALAALLGSDEADEQLAPAIREAAEIGHTSGVDLLVGALLVPLAIAPRLASGR